ncbi:hypothetical protein AfiDRAFT_1061 [Afipia sp. 1NLS2]|nr:hypothetical protein AfiDRAFT_1061 [Afipia sp. 1NLS2]
MDPTLYTRSMTGQRPTPRLFAICQCCVSDGVPRRSFIVALIVGTILNLINQGDALFGDGRVNWAKIILTFAVPYCVATYGAVSYRLTAPRSAR